MFLELMPEISSEEEQLLVGRLERMGFQVKQSLAKKLAITGGMNSFVQSQEFAQLPFVQKVHTSKNRFVLASRHYRKDDTIISMKGVKIGGGSLFVVAGPCSIESQEQMLACASAAKLAGAQGLRGGAFKPRSSPYDFQGLQEEGLKFMQKAGQDHGLVTVSEVMEISQIPLLLEYVDVLQVGARNMQNFSLLKELGKLKIPILLKRGFSATYQDLLMSAEYILSEGNPHVILCERGIRTFEVHTRNTLDLNAVPVLKELTHLPIVVDPSHGTGIRSLVSPMAKASLAAGADGLMMEIHPHPDLSVSDAAQTLSLEAFAELMKELQMLHYTLRSHV